MSDAKYRKNPKLLDEYMKERKNPTKSIYYDLWKSQGGAIQQEPDSIFDDLNPILEANEPQELPRETIITLLEAEISKQTRGEKVDDLLVEGLLQNKTLTYDDFARLLKTPLTHKQRINLIENPNFPEGFLNMLGVRRDLRPIVAKNPKVNLKLLEKMAEDSEIEVRIAVAQNPITPKNIIEKLKNDPIEVVRKFALKR